jgi:catechol 2,3-dioxygenase-like lactoylglutathione lyase family enzyme
VILGVGHFSFTVNDAERAAEWYAQHLGFELAHVQRQENAYTRRLVGIDDAVLRVAILRTPGSRSSLLELVEYVHPRTTGRVPVPGAAGFAHLSLLVDDIHLDHRRLREAGVRFRSEPIEITAGVNTGGFVCYLVDPDGNGLELFEPPAVRSERLGSAATGDPPAIKKEGVRDVKL